MSQEAAEQSKQLTPSIAVNGRKMRVGTAKLNTVINPVFITASVLFILLMACSYNAQIVENAADGTRLNVDGSGTAIHGSGLDISGNVHIAEVFYSDGSFWSQGEPTALGKWINKRSHLQVRFTPRDTKEKSVYLSPPHDIPAEKVDSDGLFKQPMLLLDSDRKDTGVYLSEAERENLRRYLVEKGGFLYVDDSSRSEGEFYRSIRRLLEELLPMYPIEPIPDDHEIYSCFYHMGGAPVGMGPKIRPLEGISINGRLAVLISQRGYWDSFTGKNRYYSPGVMRFGTNMVVYAVTRGRISDNSEYSP